MPGAWRCAAALTAALTALACSEKPVERARLGDRLSELGRPNLVLFVVDTLRADRLTPYGAAPGSSPELSEWAAHGVTFERAYAQSSWTKSSMASMLTSLWPRSHGVKKMDDGLGSGALTLGEILRDAGYRTYAVQTNGWLAQSFGFQQGFERYMFPAPTSSESEGPASLWPHADTLYEGLLGFLPELDPEQPFFLYLHFMDVHEYAAPTDVPRTGTGSKAAYGASVRWVDEVIGRTRRELEQRGLAKRTILVLASDHGEEFGEHGVQGHARNVLSGVLHVPLLIRFPFPIEPVRVATQVRNLDLAPTLLELAQVPAPESFEGTSLVPEIEGSGGAADLPSFASLPTRMYPDASPGDSVSDGRWTFVRNLEDGREQLFDRNADPDEHVNLVELEPGEAQRMRAQLTQYLAQPPRPSIVENSVRIDPEVAEKLRAVGYFR